MKSLHFPLDLNAKIDALKTELDRIVSTVEQKLTSGSPVAQAKRLVAGALLNEAKTLFTHMKDATTVLKPKEPSVDSLASPSDCPGWPQEHLEVSKGMAELIASQIGVKPEAIGPFLIESSNIMLGIIELMVNQAKQKLVDADAS